MPALAPRPALVVSLAPLVSLGSTVGAPDIEETVGPLVRGPPKYYANRGAPTRTIEEAGTKSRLKEVQSMEGEWMHLTPK